MLIGEVAARSGISARMLRHYDRIGLVTPSGRSSGGYREYAPQDVQRLFHVEALRSLGLSLQEVAAALDDLAFDPGPMVEQLLARTQARIAREQELADRLTQVRTADPGAWSDVLRVIGLMRGLTAEDPSTRQRAALTGTGGVAPLTDAALGEAEPNVAGALYWSLARRGDAAVPALADALRAPDAHRRRRAVAALEKIGTAVALEALAGAVDSADPLVRARAALARGASGGVDVVPVLVELVTLGQDDVAAADVLGALATRHGHATAVVGAIDDALVGASVPGRRRLVAALAEVPVAAARAVLTRCLDDPDEGVAVTAAALARTALSGTKPKH